jgi:hypothetical protein
MLGVRPQQKERQYMKRIFVPTLSGAAWQALLAKPVLHWKPGKSAMSTAVCWEAAATHLPTEIEACLASSGEPALASLRLLLAIPEWEVPLPGGETTSHTDVLAIASNPLGLVSIAVEAKVDEEFGPTLGEKRSAASAGQIERLDYLHSVLGVKSPLPDSLRYQLLHRTASAVLIARDFHAATAVMIVQSFSPEDRWREDFRAFASALGTPRESGQPLKIAGHLHPTLYLAWCKGDLRHRDVDLRVAV